MFDPSPSRQIPSMSRTCISESEMINEMARVFTANADSEGKHVYNKAGIKPRTGRENVWTVFNDVRSAQTPPGISRVVTARVALEENQIEICSPIVHGTGRFLRDEARLVAQEFARDPDGPAALSYLRIHRRSTPGFWGVDFIRSPGTPAFIRVCVGNVRDLRELLDDMLGIHVDAEIPGPPQANFMDFLDA